MSDRYAQLTRLPVAGTLTKRIGLPRPVELERGPGDIEGRVVLGGDGRLRESGSRALATFGAEVAPAGSDDAAPGDDAAAARAKALVFDASGIADSAGLVALQRFFYAHLRGLQRCGRVVVLAGPADSVAQRALEGFTRSLAKEVGRGIAVQLVRVAPGAEDQLSSTLRFLLSPRSAYVSGQVISISASDRALPDSLDGKVALVTGAARGIGASIAEVLEREGASIVRLDVAGADIELDITTDEAPEVIARHFRDGLDVIVHNAGVTKDRTLAKMPEDRWQSLMEVNLIAPERITERLMPLLHDDGRIVCVSSMSGIAGNAGQTNYATSKAGVIGLVETLAPALERGITINAVAPGFIETQMTAAMPIPVREAGRRMNSMRQGGLPVDVAETIAWLASPASAGVNGNVVRVCGQSLLGA
jgi:3-oxoacyl-[acyl-carrier protein] reductase